MNTIITNQTTAEAEAEAVAKAIREFCQAGFFGLFRKALENAPKEFASKGEIATLRAAQAEWDSIEVHLDRPTPSFTAFKLRQQQEVLAAFKEGRPPPLVLTETDFYRQDMLQRERLQQLQAAVNESAWPVMRKILARVADYLEGELRRMEADRLNYPAMRFALIKKAHQNALSRANKNKLLISASDSPRRTLKGMVAEL